ncbi:hypothetical protein [Chromohalobacter sp. 296-RDG]|uniref:hypothetical protein n=1 Tax=Chromohalobacter sp. 296-RDG TaxID=2994062 RepID=UPI00246849E1|nr:hypothetical protein [Chromohalobacter sp. 296-RDG]
MHPRMTSETYRVLTRLTRQLLKAGEHTTDTHVLAEGRLYRVAVSLEPVPADQLDAVINRYR